MTALATSTDVEAVIGRTLTAAEDAQIESALDAASAAVREATGRKYEAGTFTVRRKVRNGSVDLDAPATVTGINDIDSNGTATAVTGYTLRGSTVYNVAGCNVEVTYTSAGLVPDEVVKVCAEMAAHKLSSEVPDGATWWSVTKGPFTESATFAAASDAGKPTYAHSKILRRYALARSAGLSMLG
jgi:hypothetical protein